MHLRLSPSTHPACFGSPVAVSANSASCRACTNSAACLAAADAFLAQQADSALIERERLALSVTRQALGRMPVTGDGGCPDAQVVASSRGVKRLPLTSAEQALLAQLPTRVASATRRLLQRGWFQFARRELQAGRNPGGKGWTRVMCHKLLQGPFTRAQLQLAFQEELHLVPASAKVQVSVSVAVMVAGGLARDFQGYVSVTPN